MTIIGIALAMLVSVILSICLGQDPMGDGAKGCMLLLGILFGAIGMRLDGFDSEYEKQKRHSMNKG